MSCWGNGVSEEEWKERQVGKCPECERPVDKEGSSADVNNCGYSSVCCKKCGHAPCDLSC